MKHIYRLLDNNTWCPSPEGCRFFIEEDQQCLILRAGWEVWDNERADLRQRVAELLNLGIEPSPICNFGLELRNKDLVPNLEAFSKFRVSFK